MSLFQQQYGINSARAYSERQNMEPKDTSKTSFSSENEKLLFTANLTKLIIIFLFNARQ